jgi:putative membrane protein
MTTNTTNRQLVWVGIAIVAALVILPVFGIGFGMMGGMWGAGGASGWMFLIGVVMQSLFLAVIVGSVYLGYRALTEQDGSSDPALEELRAAYARGDLTNENGPSATHDGETYHFCSAACKRAFEETPVEFATTDPVISDGHDHH